jgi:peptidoglycan/LPS O-acetylase OafA/YrhL
MSAAITSIDTAPAPSNRLQLLEGLRFYLAAWVVADHVLGRGGYSPASLSGVLRLLRCGWYAVDVFVILSGFVIFLLLDRKQESYSSFITRRFFRLWPLMILLYLVAIPVSWLDLHNAKNAASHLDTETAHEIISAHHAWVEYGVVNTILHATMLHGIVPERIIPAAPTAFLSPAWSISLEWQFYLVAPLFFLLIRRSVTSGYAWGMMVASVSCIALILAVRVLPEVGEGAFLPFHAEFFAIGAISYFLYRYLEQNPLPFSVVPLGMLCAVITASLGRFNAAFIPFCLWALAFSLLVDVRTGRTQWLTARIAQIISNRLTNHLGKISYSIYLSHMLVIWGVQYLLLRMSPGLSQVSHTVLLAALTFPVTILISHFLYQCVEASGNRVGGRLANSFGKRSEVQPHLTSSPT